MYSMGLDWQGIFCLHYQVLTLYSSSFTAEEQASWGLDIVHPTPRINDQAQHSLALDRVQASQEGHLSATPCFNPIRSKWVRSILVRFDAVVRQVHHLKSRQSSSDLSAGY